jgi:hypothetical protein
VLKRYIEGKLSLADAYESAVDEGGENHALKKMIKFRDWLATKDAEEDCLDCNKTIRDKMIFQLKEIERRSKKVRELLEKKKTGID